jgi:hypothetical protein
MILTRLNEQSKKNEMRPCKGLHTEWNKGFGLQKGLQMRYLKL